MKIFVESNRYGHYIVSNDTNNETRYFQTDYDFPSLASTFGWEPCEECNTTDGTVPCEHKAVSEMIQSAIEYLDNESLMGNSVDDPGYFD